MLEIAAIAPSDIYNKISVQNHALVSKIINCDRSGINSINVNVEAELEHRILRYLSRESFSFEVVVYISACIYTDSRR